MSASIPSREAPAREESPPCFDTILRQLQALVEQLENEDLPLEGALQAFERGMELSRKGQEILDAAEQRVELLLRDGSTEPMKVG